MKRGRQAFAIMFAVLSGTVASASACGAQVGLVLQISGPVQPQIKAFDEVAAGQRIVLSDKSTITIFHYRICQKIKQFYM